MRKNALAAATHLVLVGEFLVDEDTSAVFAGEDTLAHAHVDDALWSDLVEATATCVTLDGYDSESVLCLLVDALE